MIRRISLHAITASAGLALSGLAASDVGAETIALTSGPFTGQTIPVFTEVRAAMEFVAGPDGLGQAVGHAVDPQAIDIADALDELGKSAPGNEMSGSQTLDIDTDSIEIRTRFVGEVGTAGGLLQMGSSPVVPFEISGAGPSVMGTVRIAHGASLTRGTDAAAFTWSVQLGDNIIAGNPTYLHKGAGVTLDDAGSFLLGELAADGVFESIGLEDEHTVDYDETFDVMLPVNEPLFLSAFYNPNLGDIGAAHDDTGLFIINLTLSEGQVVPVPEPASLALSAGLLGMLTLAHRPRRGRGVSSR